MEFRGRALALSAEGFDAAANVLGVKAPELWAVLSVETKDCGFSVDRRPKILFERHIFHRLTSGRFDGASDISSATPGGYGADGAHQYDRLARAIALDRTAALSAASWGLGQVMGFNYQRAGSPDIERFVADMVDGEDLQLKAAANFMKSQGLDAALRGHRWADFARGYNGKDYAKNNYDQRLLQAYAAHSVGTLPDLTVRKVQLYLRYLGFDARSVDGVLGRFTRAAIADFQTSAGLTASGEPTQETIDAIENRLTAG